MKTITPKLDVVFEAKNHLGETPIWVENEQALYWINCEEPPQVHCYRPSSKEHRMWPMPQRIGGLAMKQGGGFLVALADGIYDFDSNSGKLAKRAASPLSSRASLHETAVDRQGRLWVGAMDMRTMALPAPAVPPTDAALCRMDGDKLIPVIPSISCSNGLAVSLDGRRLYHTDCPTGIVDMWDLDPATGSVSNKRELFRVPPQNCLVDGATVDSEGGYWACLVFMGVLRRYLPDNTLDLEVKLPISSPTKVVFGGPDMDTMFITSTDIEYGHPNRGGNMVGAIVSFKPGVKGVREPQVKA